MRKLHILIVILFFSLNLKSQFLTKEQAVEDLKYLYTSIQNVHPELFWYKSKNDADVDYAELMKKIDSGVDNEIFYSMIAEFVSGFNSSHLDVGLPLLSLGDFSKSAKLNPLPLEFNFTSKGLFVKDNIVEKGNIKRGDHILAINGNSVDTIFSEFQKLNKSIRNFDVWENYSNFFMEYYRIQFGDTNEFHFRYIDWESNDTLSETLSPISVDRWGEYFMDSFPQEKFYYDYNEKHNTGIKG